MKVKIKESGWSLLRENYFFLTRLQLDRIGFLSGCMNQISDEIRIAWRAMCCRMICTAESVPDDNLQPFYPYSAQKIHLILENQDQWNRSGWYCRAKVWENRHSPCRHGGFHGKGLNAHVSTKNLPEGINDRFRLIIQNDSQTPPHCRNTQPGDAAGTLLISQYFPECTIQFVLLQ